jgi:hypothetical protein
MMEHMMQKSLALKELSVNTAKLALKWIDEHNEIKGKYEIIMPNLYEEMFEIIDYRQPQALPNERQSEKFWYLATTYTIHKTGKEQANLDASKMSAFLQDNDIFVFSPVAHFHDMHGFSKNGDDYEFWMKYCFKFVSLSKGVIVCTMPGWEQSKGIAREVKLALELGLPAIYTDFMELPKFV